METKDKTPPRWALALACAALVVELVALPLIPDGWPILANLAAVGLPVLLAWRAWPFRPDGADD